MTVALPVLDITSFSDRTTRYQKSIKPAPTTPSTSGLYVLKDAGSNAKIGKLLTKGRWRGMPLFALTLIERATCWSGCQAAAICYGDNMPFATRYEPGPGLERAITDDVATLASRKATRSGFVVRTHVLGDFYSVAYVRHWAALVASCPALHVYGYTHWRHASPIGRAVATLVQTFPDQVAILRSDADEAEDPLPKAMTISRGAPAAPGTVLCPEQTGKTTSCGTCGLCMSGRNAVSFIDHSRQLAVKPAVSANDPGLLRP